MGSFLGTPFIFKGDKTKDLPFSCPQLSCCTISSACSSCPLRIALQCNGNISWRSSVGWSHVTEMRGKIQVFTESSVRKTAHKWWLQNKLHVVCIMQTSSGQILSQIQAKENWNLNSFFQCSFIHNCHRHYIIQSEQLSTYVSSIFRLLLRLYPPKWHPWNAWPDFLWLSEGRYPYPLEITRYLRPFFLWNSATPATMHT